MIKEVKLPEVSDNVETGDVLKVLVSVGDKVEIDQPLVELETEKATFEVPSTESGIVKEVNVKQGDVIKIGDVIVKLETNGSDEEKNESSDSKTKVEEKKNDKEKVIETEEDVKGSKEKKEEGKNGKEKKSKTNVEQKNEDVKESEEEPKEESKDEKEEDEGDKEKQEKDEKDNGAEKDEEDKEEKKEDKESESDQKNEKPEGKEDKESGKENRAQSDDENITESEAAPASPSVRRLARELGVEIKSVSGSGPAGRISEEDIKSFVKSRMQSGSASTIKHKALPDFSKWGEVDIQPISKIRSITADSMTYAWTTIPMVTQFDKADITELDEFRKNQIKKDEKSASHLTITSILVKACEAALRSFPQFNASIDSDNKEIIFKKFFNIGVAVDTERGLLVPVIRNVDKKKILEISNELNELAEKARSKKISPDEMDGGNFTISNLGGIGGTGFSPIVYSPQVAILGVSR